MTLSGKQCADCHAKLLMIYLRRCRETAANDDKGKCEKALLDNTTVPP
jgi:hypothetical protein